MAALPTNCCATEPVNDVDTESHTTFDAHTMLVKQNNQSCLDEFPEGATHPGGALVYAEMDVVEGYGTAGPVCEARMGRSHGSQAPMRPNSGRPGTAATGPGSSTGSRPGSAAGSRPGSAAGSRPSSADGARPGSAQPGSRPTSSSGTRHLGAPSGTRPMIRNPLPLLEEFPAGPGMAPYTAGVLHSGSSLNVNHSPPTINPLAKVAEDDTAEHQRRQYLILKKKISRERTWARLAFGLAMLSGLSCILTVVFVDAELVKENIYDAASYVPLFASFSVVFFVAAVLTFFLGNRKGRYLRNCLGAAKRRRKEYRDNAVDDDYSECSDTDEGESEYVYMERGSFTQILQASTEIPRTNNPMGRSVDALTALREVESERDKSRGP